VRCLAHEHIVPQHRARGRAVRRCRTSTEITLVEEGTMEQSYTPPVSALLELGGAHDAERSAESLGIGAEHLPELLRMAVDDALFSESDVEDEGMETGGAEFWGPVHAWRILGEMGAPEAVPVLLDALVRYHESDYPAEVIPLALGRIGAAALEPARQVLFDDGIADDDFVQAAAGDALVEIARAHPGLRDEVVAALTAKLEMYETNEVVVSSIVASHLMDLRAAEAMPLIETVYGARGIDPVVTGDLEDIEIAMGLRKERTVPRRPLFPVLPMRELGGPDDFGSGGTGWQRTSPRAAEKAKRKKKAEKQARKKNKKRKK
jgi:hypothetical protein